MTASPTAPTSPSPPASMPRPVAREHLESRLAELRRDHGEGERALRELDGRREQLQVSLLRVGGAIQVLEELLTSTAAGPGGAGEPLATSAREGPEP